MTTETPRERPGTPWSGAEPGDPMDDRRCRATSKRSGVRCKRYAIPGGRVCTMHGGASPAVRAAAERRRAEAEATVLLELVWDPSAEPVTDPVAALQRLAGRLEHAANVLGARLAAAELDGPTGLAWARVLRELRQALEGMQRLDLAGKHIELEQGRVQMVTAAFRAAIGVLGLVPSDRDLAVRTFLTTLGVDVPAPLSVVRGEVE